MLVKATGRSKIKFALSFMVMVTMFSAMWGCGGGGGDFKTIYPSDSRLLSVETLKSWIDAGKVNSGSYDNVVILDVDMDPNEQHIPGAQKLVRKQLYQIRIEGVAATDNMVLSGAAMDNLIKGFGINVNTTIVFTGSSWIVTRAYFTFRYWGFPKENLFILDGLNPKWETTYPDTLTDQEAVVTASEFSVRDNEILGKDLRYSLGEMMAAVESDDAVMVDMRGGNSGTSYYGNKKEANRVFVGHPKGAQALYRTDLMSDSYNFKDPNVLRDTFEGLGLSSSKTGIMYCNAGNLATAGYFALEGILNWPSAVYDGSWSQMGLMSANADQGGSLPVGCKFAVDAEDGGQLLYMDTNSFAYSKDVCEDLSNPWNDANNPWPVPAVNLIDEATMATFTGTNDTRANQIENEDAAYMAGDEAAKDVDAGDAGDAGGDDSCG